MMEKRWVSFWIVVASLAILGASMRKASVRVAHAGEVPRMTKEELKGMLANPDVIIIDVRSGLDWNGSNLKIKGAVREDPKKVSSWADQYSRDKVLIFYCA